jgi:nicotinamide-nucleotide amidase
MNAIILSIGDELVLGQTVDTNSAWLSARLASLGWAVAAHVTVADDQRAIEAAVRQAAAACDFLLINGGLGPTADDLTRQAVAAAMNQPLELNSEWLGKLEGFFLSRGRKMPEINRIQAMIPRGARLIENSAGTAPGIAGEIRVGEKTCRIFVMPGVPKEMKLMFDSFVAPKLAGNGRHGVILSRTLHTFGIGESVVAEKLGSLMDRDRNPSVGTTVSAGIVSLRINARFGDTGRAGEELEKVAEACRTALGNLIYGQDGQTLQEVVGKMLLAKPPRRVSVAESCTGGLLGKMLTDVPGSSAYFSRGWITYSDDAKHDLLGVSQATLQEHSAVSEATAIEMAAGARKNSGADIALSITGIAGPDGDSSGKPVGTVYIGLAHAGGTWAREFHFPGDREMIRDRAAKMALALLRFHLLGVRATF